MGRISKPGDGTEQRLKARQLAAGLNELRVLDAILEQPSARTKGYVFESAASLAIRSGIHDEANTRRAMRALRHRGLLRFADDRRTAPFGTRLPILLGHELWPPDDVPYLPDEEANTLVIKGNGAPKDGWVSRRSDRSTVTGRSGKRPVNADRYLHEATGQW
jgi:hypothetical protein